MKTFTVPGTEWEVSKLAYGCGAIGGTWDPEPLNEAWRAKAFAALDAALEIGINFFDHADVYTFGKSEQVFGEFLSSRPGLRESIFIQSKSGLWFNNTPNHGDPARYDFSYEHIMASVEGSLKRLKIDYLDALLLHRPDMLVEPEEVARAFDKLESDGKVRRFGVSNHNVMQMELLRKHLRQPLMANQLQLSLAHPALIAEGVYVNQDRGETTALATGILDYCRLHGIQVQAWSPLGGIGFYGKRKIFQPHPRQTLLNALQLSAERHGCSVQAVMLAWLFRHPAGIQPILGTLTPARLRELVKVEEIAMDRKEWYRLFSASQGGKLP